MTFNNTIKTFSYKEAVEELNTRKKNKPKMIHLANYENGSMYIKSFSIKDYVKSKVNFVKSIRATYR